MTGNYYYKKPNLKNESYDDTQLKNKMIEVIPEILGFNVKINENDNGKGIDLYCVDVPEIGVEAEKGWWIGDFWSNEPYCRISNLGFSTINAPIRKEKYWMERYFWFGREMYNPSWDKNIFVRTNVDFSQIIVVLPKIINDQTKVYRSRFKPKNSNDVEDWICFKREDVQTYNKVNGRYILETEENGKYPQITEEEQKRLLRERTARAAEVFKAKKTKYLDENGKQIN